MLVPLSLTRPQGNRKRRGGFTIVELLIVIVIIGILATISAVAYSGVQNRTRDSKRLHDMQASVKALEMYKTMNGTYPTPTYNGPGGWESSSISLTDFIQPLKTSGVVSAVGIDPVNSASMEYRYYVYPAGNAGCDASRGAFFILGVLDMQGSGRPHPQSPGWSCPSRNWQGEFDWVTGGFVN